MMPTTSLTIRLDANFKRKLTKKLNELGLSFNSYVMLAAEQLLVQEEVPFEIKTMLGPKEKVTFNEKTRRAIIRSQSEKVGLIPKVSKDFTNAAEFMNALNDDE